jgi:hypothetical protein
MKQPLPARDHYMKKTTKGLILVLCFSLGGCSSDADPAITDGQSLSDSLSDLGGGKNADLPQLKDASTKTVDQKALTEMKILKDLAVANPKDLAGGKDLPSLPKCSAKIAFSCGKTASGAGDKSKYCNSGVCQLCPVPNYNCDGLDSCECNGACKGTSCYKP